MWYNLRKIIFISAGSCLLLTVNLWLLGFPAPAVNRPALANSAAPASVRAQPAQTRIEISSTVQLTGTKRLGMNLGGHVENGSYLFQNIIRNAGFEAGEYSMVFVAQAGATPTRVQASWNLTGFGNRQPVGFWNGADYEVIHVTSTVGAGTVLTFTRENNQDTFYLAGTGAGPVTNSALLVRQAITGYCCSTQLPQQPAPVAAPGDIRPGSPGTQSLQLLTPTTTTLPSWRYEFDTFGQNRDRSAGKLFLAGGDWHFAIWARAANAGNSLRVRFRRSGTANFLDQTFPLSTTWRHLTHDFTVAAQADPPLPLGSTITPTALFLELYLAQGSGPVWVDDIALARRGQNNPTVFSDKVVTRLLELQPGILRNWGMEQLGSTLDNQLAVPWARRTNGYEPNQAVANQWHYSLHEFLELAALIDAEPWYVIPPTFSTTELQNLVAYLAAEPGAHPYADRRVMLGQTEPWTTRFATMHLEWGNEAWGGNGVSNPFLGASFSGGARLGGVAHNRFAIMRASPFFVADRFNLIIGSQARNLNQTMNIENNSAAHDSIALAPYFYTGDQRDPIDAWASPEELFYPLYALPQQSAQPSGRMGEAQEYLHNAGQGTELVVYEINFHTTASNSIPITLRNDLVTGLGGGLALPLFMLTYQQDLGLRHQNVWRLAAFSNPVAGSPDEDVRLFGTLRDLEATGRKRSIGLGVELANHAIRGDLLQTRVEHGPTTVIQPPINGITGTTPLTLPLIQAFAYREGSTYAVIVFNLHLTASQTVQLRLPSLAQATATLHTLTASNVYSNNEASEQVQIVTTQLDDFTQDYPLTLAPHSAYVLEWQGVGIKPALYLSVVRN